MAADKRHLMASVNPVDPAGQLLRATADHVPAGSPVLLPNVIDIVDSHLPKDVLAEFSATLSTCNSVVADVTRLLKQAVDDCATVCLDAGDACCGCLTARVDAIALSVVPLIGKCNAKIERAAKDQFARTASYAMSVGCEFPPDDVVSQIVNGVPANVALSKQSRSPAGIFNTDPMQGLGGGVVPINPPPGGPIAPGGPGQGPGGGGGAGGPCPPPTGGPVPIGTVSCPTGDPLIGNVPAQAWMASLPFGQGEAEQWAAARGLKVLNYQIDPSGCVASWCVIEAPPPDDGGSGGGSGDGSGNKDCPPASCLPQCEDGTVGYLMSDGTVKCDTAEQCKQPNMLTGSTDGGRTLNAIGCPNGYDLVRNDDGKVIEAGTGQADYPYREINGPDDSCFNYSCKLHADSTEPPPPPPPTQPTVSCSPKGLVKLFANVNDLSNIGHIGEITKPEGSWTDIFSLPSVASTLTDIFYSMYNGQHNFTEKLFAVLPFPPECANTALAEYGIVGAGLNFLQRWFGVIPQALVGYNQQQQNLACQWIIPTAGDMNELSVKSFIDSDEWEAGVAANGHCLDWEKLRRDASYSYPGISDTINLWRRRIIDDGTFSEYMLRAGVKDDTFGQQFAGLTNYVAPVAETITWHQKGVINDDLASPLSLDQGFDEYWNRDGDYSAKVYGENQDTAKLQYRCTWTLPALSTAMEAFARIRTETVIPGTTQPVTPVTTQELEALAKIQRMPGNWANRLAYLSFVPVSLRHLRMLWITGQVTRDDLIGRYRQLQFSPDDSTKMADALIATSADQRAKFQGFPSRTEILSLFKQDGYTKQEAKSALIFIGMKPDDAESALQNADNQQAAVIRRVKIAALKRRFMTGDYDRQQVIRKLTDYGVADDRIPAIADDWSEQLSLKRREVAVGTLCEWAGRGYITPDDFLRRLDNLGYIASDASHFMANCATKHAEQLQAALTRAIEKAASKAKAAAKERAAAIKAANAAARARAKAADPFRDPPKPYRVPKVTHHRTVTQSTTDKGPPPKHTTETETTSSG